MFCPGCGADLTGVIRHECPAGRRRIIPGRLVTAGLAALAVAILAIITALITHHSNGTPVPVRIVTVTPHVTVVPRVTVTTVTASPP